MKSVGKSRGLKPGGPRLTSCHLLAMGPWAHHFNFLNQLHKIMTVKASQIGPEVYKHSINGSYDIVITVVYADTCCDPAVTSGNNLFKRPPPPQVGP